MNGLRLVTISDGGRPVALEDLNSVGGTFLARDSLRVAQPARRGRVITGARRNQGQRIDNTLLDNASISGQLIVRDGTGSATATAALVERLLNRAERATALARTVYLEVLFDGLTRAVYWPLRGPATVTPATRTREWAGGRFERLDVTWPTAPLAEGLPLNICDSFDVDSLADYTFDAGAGTLTVAGGNLVPSTVADKRLYHSARGYRYVDAEVTVKFRTGASGAGFVAATIKRLNAGLAAWAQINGGTGNLTLELDNGAVNLATGAGAALAANTDHWVLGRIEGNVLTAELWTTDPALGGAPNRTANALLTTAQAAVYGAGIAGDAGIRFTPAAVDWRVDDFRVDPYTYGSTRTPGILVLPAVPGNAPARVDLELAAAAGTTVPFALATWRPRPRTHSFASNGDLEDDVDGWSTAGVSFHNVPATSITRVTTAAKFGSASAQVVTPATAFAGVNLKLTRRFRRGVPHTAVIYLRVPAGGPDLIAKLGDASADSAQGSLTPTAAWQPLTVTWTPTADRETAYLSVFVPTATATTFQIDGVAVFEGTVAPSSPRDLAGAGGDVPFGPVYADGDDAGGRVNFARVADASAPSGGAMRCTATSGSLRYVIAPELLDALEGDDETVDVELYAMGIMSPTIVAPRLVASVRGERGSLRTYARESGALGRGIIVPSSAGAWASRLGTIPLAVGDVSRGRAELIIDYTASISGNFDVRYLFLAPVARRVGSPTGKVRDLYYPTFAAFAAGGTVAKRITSDGGGLEVTGVSTVRGTGLGGEPIELDPGTNELALLAYTAGVPDEPAGAGYQAADVTFTRVRARVVPRYRLMRDA